MLYFRDYHWLLVNGYSHFNAFITSQHRRREDVTWFLNLRYEATGSWDLRRDPETDGYVQNPGWSSTVSFSTTPMT